ncbi:glycoside hydrolase superfamily [Achaetomium macrosporum]|uniref:Glycoside hydrolase superfamily n=1 Tax=Achaetomium macrosporum TaxID=79813 RepID=A0AAN7H9Z6_9PEZI|nr:glycoside hydrolase superfamily [Achaetomium macrosporum]
MPEKTCLRPGFAGVLPPDFLHGYASAAYQVDGATSKGGRGPCNWDEMLKDYPDNGDDACRSYDLWEEDDTLLQQPCSSHQIDALWAANTEPTITLCHYDTPLALDKRYRGFAVADPRELVDNFVSFAKVCFDRFGDRAKRWLTINEVKGLVKDYTHANFFRVGHNSLLAHGYAVQLYRKEFQESQKGQIDIALNYDWAEPVDGSEEPIKAAALSEERSLGWFALPIFKGVQTTSWDHYGDEFPRLTQEELGILKGSADFFSINHYGTMYTTGRQLEPNTATHFRELDDLEKTLYRDGVLIGRRGENGHPHTVPWGFRNLLNGYAVEHEAKMPLEAIVEDEYRQEFYDLYIGVMCSAVKEEGVKMAGYHCWSLLDNLEWNNGYTPRFGVTYIDRANGFQRVPKKSSQTGAAIWDHVVRK